MHAPRPAALVLIATLAGMVLATVLGLVTFGVQASVEPRGLPLAVTVPDAGPAALQQVAQRVASQGGEQVSWRVVPPAEARRLLDEKAVYGVLELPSTVVLSGAINPTGTQVAQQVLTAAGQAAAQAVTQAGGQAAPLAVQTVHPATAVRRTVPLAAATLLWLGTLIGSVLIVVVSGRARRRTTVPVRLAGAVLLAVGATAAVLGLFALWDVGLFGNGVNGPLVGFLLLTAFGYAAVQGAVLRLAGLPGLAVLAPLYLMAPAVAGQVPEVLHPAYRVLLWSWSPMRFATEAVRSLLMLDTVPPDVRTAIWVLAGMAAGGLIVLLWPGGRRPARPDADDAAASQRVPAAA